MVTSKEISNCLGDHPRRNTLIYESTYKVYILVIGGNFGRHQNASFCYQKVATGSRSPGVCLCIRIRAMMHHVYTGEAVVTTQNTWLYIYTRCGAIPHSELGTLVI